MEPQKGRYLPLGMLRSCCPTLIDTIEEILTLGEGVDDARVAGVYI